MRAIFLLAPKARNHACCLLQRSIIIQVFITTIHVFVALVVMLLFSCSLFLHATNHSDNVAYLSFPSLMSLCCIWSVFSFFPYLHLHKHPSLSAFFQPAPSLLFLHVSNDRGIILLPLMAFRLPLSLSNDCSYLILPYPCSLSFSLSHYSSHSLPTPQVSLYATVSSAVFFFSCSVSLYSLSPYFCLSIQQARVMLLHLCSFIWITARSAQVERFFFPSLSTEHSRLCGNVSFCPKSLFCVTLIHSSSQIFCITIFEND